MKREYLILSLLFLSTIKLAGQKIMSPVEIKSPQSYSFEKYGNVPVNLYTGSIDIKIPVANIGDNEIDISAMLVYDSSGFIPHKKSDAAGVNWALIAGGRITRNLNETPDEYIGNPESASTSNPYGSGKDLHGFLKGIKSNSPTTNVNVYNLNSGVGNTNSLHWWMGESANGYEGTPDTFSFNVMGLSGKFIIGNNGNVLVESDDPNIKVDVSQMAIYGGTAFCVPPASIIKITDGKGTQYFFGGDLSKYEISYSYTKDPSSGSHPFFKGHPMINAFSLSKIIFTDKKEINFEYEQGSLNDNFCDLVPWTNAHNNEKLLSLETYNQDGARASEWKNCPGGISCAYTMSSEPSNTITFVLLKKSVLKSIKYFQEEIKINYVDTGYPINHAELTSQYLNEFVIDNVETYYKDILIKKNQFSYDHLGGTFKRPFLKSIKEIKSDHTYSFEYDKTNSLPPYYTKGIDHWGYWNGGDTNVSLAPFDTYNATTGDYTLNNTFRDADQQKYNVALLNKIIYPTKGYTTFEYEPQYYGKRIERTSTSLFLPTLTNNSGLAGGARIRKVLNYAVNGVLNTEKEFKYTTAINESSSSGILMNWPRYFYYIEMYGNSMVQKLMIKTSSNVQQNSLDSYNVGYSKVFEIDKNKGYIEHNFTTYASHPDVLNPDTSNLREYMTGYTNFVPLNLYKNFKNLYGVDKSILRGKPLKERFFSEVNFISPIKVVDYEYYDNMDYNPNNSTDNSNYVSINHLSGVWVQGYRRFMNSAPIKKKTITDYLGNTQIVNQSEYIYDSPLNLNLSKTKNISPDDQIQTTYTYATGNTPLVTANMIGIPLKTEVIKNGKTISKVETKYENSYPLELLPSSVVSYNLESNIADTEVTYDMYTYYKKVEQYTTKNGTPVTILWGYHGTKPIAKLEGIKWADAYSTVYVTAATKSDLDVDAASEQILIAALDNLRSDIRFKNCFITTYTYDPLIGVTSVTPPNGMREVYIYDNANRLQFVKDVYGNILKDYQYHYKP